MERTPRRYLGSGHPDVFDPTSVDSLRQILDEQGYVFLTNLSQPFDYVSFLGSFGPLLSQYDGKTIWSIEPKAEFDAEEITHSLNRKPLRAHTECYEFSGIPPRFLALWCIRPASDGGGKTLLADGRRFVTSLPQSDRNYLENHRFPFESTTGIKETGLERSAYHPVYDTRSRSAPILRLSLNAMAEVSKADRRLSRLLAQAASYFERTAIAVPWRPGDLLIWDNFRMLHGREGFEDKNRELRRAWIADGHDAVLEPARVPAV